MQKLEKLRPSAVEKFVRENAGKCIARVDGSLIDNVVYSFPFGTMFCFETFANEWASDYTVLFFRKGRERGISKAWERINELEYALH